MTETKKPIYDGPPPTLTDIWQRFKANQLDKITADFDRTDPRWLDLVAIIERAFYAGAAGAFSVFDYLAENEPEMQEGLRLVEKLYYELTNFYDSIKKNTTSDDAAASE